MTPPVACRIQYRGIPGIFKIFFVLKQPQSAPETQHFAAKTRRPQSLKPTVFIWFRVCRHTTGLVYVLSVQPSRTLCLCGKILCFLRVFAAILSHSFLT